MTTIVILALAWSVGAAFVIGYVVALRLIPKGRGRLVPALEFLAMWLLWPWPAMSIYVDARAARRQREKLEAELAARDAEQAREEKKP